MSDVIYDVDTLWELVERRTAASPDQVMLLDERDRRMTFREVRDASERCAAGLLELGISAGTAVAWQLPTRIESIVPVPRARSARCGADPDHPDLPGPRSGFRAASDRHAVVRRAG